MQRSQRRDEAGENNGWKTEKRRRLSPISTLTAAEKNDVDRKARFIEHREDMPQDRGQHTYQENRVQLTNITKEKQVLLRIACRSADPTHSLRRL
jgi:hypothetical protein